MQLPHRFLAGAAAEAGIALPPGNAYGVGMMFLPADVADRIACEEIVARVAARGRAAAAGLA